MLPGVYTLMLEGGWSRFLHPGHGVSFAPLGDEEVVIISGRSEDTSCENGRVIVMTEVAVD